LKRFGIKEGKGLLILVNDGNYALEADAVVYLLKRILGTSFRQINSVVYCTVNMFASSPMTPKPTLFWAHIVRGENPSPVGDGFIMRLYHGWSAHLSKISGIPIETVMLTDPSVISRIRYIDSDQNQ
jgi:hypothetical protein